MIHLMHLVCNEHGGEHVLKKLIGRFANDVPQLINSLELERLLFDHVTRHDQAALRPATLHAKVGSPYAHKAMLCCALDKHETRNKEE
jgi:hypothetical protein